MATEIIQLSPNIPTEASIILRNIETLPSSFILFPVILNTDIKDKQRLLELNNIRERARPADGIIAKRTTICRTKK